MQEPSGSYDNHQRYLPVITIIIKFIIIYYARETGINNETQNDEQTKTDHEVSLRTDTQDGDMDTSSSRPTCMTSTVRSRDQVVRILSKGSFFAIGLAILVAGGMASNYHPYYVNPNEYNSCTIPPKLNETM